MLGVLIAQDLDGPEGVWEPVGDGVRIQVSNPGGSPLRLQLLAPANETEEFPSWCVDLEVFDVPVFVPWASFTKECWNVSGAAYQREPIRSANLQVPGDDDEILPFHFCLEDLGPATEAGAAGLVTLEQPALLESCPSTDCVARAGDASELAIDSVAVSTDDADGTEIETLGNRQGSWYVYCDEVGEWTSGVDDGRTPIPSEGGYDGAGLAMVISGWGFHEWGATLGLNPSFQSGGVCNYDASMYRGVEFWATGVGTIRFNVETRATLLCDGYTHGLCPDDDGCFDHFGFAFELPDEWTRYEITWDVLEQKGWGLSAGVFDPTTIAGLQWLIDVTNDAFTIGVDEVRFLAP